MNWLYIALFLLVGGAGAVSGGYVAEQLIKRFRFLNPSPRPQRRPT